MKTFITTPKALTDHNEDDMESILPGSGMKDDDEGTAVYLRQRTEGDDSAWEAGRLAWEAGRLDEAESFVPFGGAPCLPPEAVPPSAHDTDGNTFASYYGDTTLEDEEEETDEDAPEAPTDAPA